ncbi:hypothetical protein TELCIR_01498 [Teladorsagia circumcincta]|uniref:Uncharacterized protein n=1 Tax=Teladorsagia circumcincta TaxID=45464 RepID=A0A2G9V1Q6_TELCI|nr:hypothetical protein TELCIR_01498 [Teladorsagia circumcincta]
MDYLVHLQLLSIALLACCLGCCLCSSPEESDSDSNDLSSSRSRCVTSNGTVHPGKTHRCGQSNGTPCSPTYSYPNPDSQDPNYYLPGYPPPYPPAYPQSYPSQPPQSPPQYCSSQPRQIFSDLPRVHVPS